jgi:hypothetical protein
MNDGENVLFIAGFLQLPVDERRYPGCCEPDVGSDMASLRPWVPPVNRLAIPAGR